MFKSLAVALDGSQCAAHAFDLALELAKGDDGRIAICSVVDPIVVLGRNPAGAYAEQALEGAEADARAVVVGAVQKARALGVTVDGTVVQGEPAYEIVQFARKQNADAVVMGTHGRTGLKRMFIGSVAEDVLRSSTVPVVIVRDKSWIAQDA
jgi:nucleotide-binding universal stress UspA family protein